MTIGNPYINALVGPAWPDTPQFRTIDNPNTPDVDESGGLLLTFYFDQDTSAGHSTAGAWTPALLDPLNPTGGGEEGSFWTAIHAWTSVAHIDILEVDHASIADMIERKVTAIPDHPAADGGHSQPEDGVPAIGYFDDSLFTMGEGSLQPGGYSFYVFMHELGHAFGLDHPFENSHDRPLFPGVDGKENGFPISLQNDPGDHGFNAIRYTVMSYNVPSDADKPNEGYPATPSVFDIAAIQFMYGAVKNNDGDNVYMLSDDMKTYTTIWDTGGTDTIQYNGSHGTTIDLRLATLQDEEGGGGFLSNVIGAGRGGFTIAADFTHFISGDVGVYIEKATGGEGQDTLTGNDFDNVLNGRGGADHLTGGRGADTLTGGDGNDSFVFDDNWGNDTITDYQVRTLAGVGDQINLFHITGLGSVSQIRKTDIGSDAKLEFSGNSVVVQGHSVAELTPINFAFFQKLGDGYIAGATVFADTNGDGQFDGGESSTTTDATGTFTLSRDLGTLVAFGGTDTSTGLAFKGRLSAPVGSLDITPLTTLLVAGADQSKLVAALGLPAGLDLTLCDPIGALLAHDDPGAKAYVAGAKVMDIVAVFGAAIANLGGNEAKAQQDAFAAIAATANNLGAGAILDLANATTIAGLFTSVAQQQGIDADSVASALASAVATSNATIDGHLASDGATPTLITDVSAVQTVILANKPPQAVNDFATATTGIGGTASADAAHGLLVNDSDPDDDPLTVTGFTGGTHGTLVLNADGSYGYTVTDLTGPTGSHLHDVLSYGITDGRGGVAVANLDIMLNRAPIAVDDSTAVYKGGKISGNVLVNDSDPDGDPIQATDLIGGTFVGKYGTLTFNADSSYSYVANKIGLPGNFVAQDTFQYSISDGDGGFSSATLSVVVLDPSQLYQAGTNTTLTGGKGPDVLDGSSGHDRLFGGNGPDVLIGGPGDTLTGGNNADTFLFRPNFGANTITDFDVNADVIQIDKSVFQTVADLLAHTSNSAAGAVINDGQGDTITLTGVTLAQLQKHTSDFHLIQQDVVTVNSATALGQYMASIFPDSASLVGKGSAHSDPRGADLVIDLGHNDQFILENAYLRASNGGDFFVT